MTDHLITKSDRKLAILVDPESHEPDKLFAFLKTVVSASPDIILVGGSYIAKSDTRKCIAELKGLTNIPILLFPGHMTQLSDNADAVLMLSLISGRNPDLLIGQHVLAAPNLYEIKEKVIPTGYVLIEGGVSTSVSYVSNTIPIPADKPKLAVSTAMAGELLGLKLIYLDAGSGAKRPVSAETIKMVRESIDVPLIVGGGIKSFDETIRAWDAGANLVVVGNIIESDIKALENFSKNSSSSNLVQSVSR